MLKNEEILEQFKKSLTATTKSISQNNLVEINFTKENSSIEQLHVKKKKGKLVISFTKNKSNFESILEDDKIKTIKYNDHTLEQFLTRYMMD